MGIRAGKSAAVIRVAYAHGRISIIQTRIGGKQHGKSEGSD